jgi:transketolase
VESPQGRPKSQRELERIAWQIRLELVEMFSHGKAHHYGGSLSCVELVTALYFYRMNYSAELMNDPSRDRFIMSKGHSVPTQYVVLSMLGILSHDELKSIKTLGTRLQGHPDVRKTPGIEAGTGSLGQGLSVANGMAMAGRLDDLKFGVFVLAGDGELQEGQIWEAAMTTAHYGLNNVCLLVDVNRYQSQGCVDECMAIEPLVDKWAAFGWRTARVDGHDIGQICQALDTAGPGSDRPLAIIADTVKGKGVPFLENTFTGHNVALTEEQYLRAKEDIELRLKSLEE